MEGAAVSEATGPTVDIAGGRRVICAQIGARDHYAYARAFQRAGLLESLMTDIWQPPGGLLPGRLGARLKDRWHPELAGAAVTSWNARMLTFELEQRLRGRDGWDKMLARNGLFQQLALSQLKTRPQAHPTASPSPTLFSYSYAARGLFRAAKARGWMTILGQIDPGPVETRRVAEVERAWPQYQTRRTAPPAGYYDAWHEELALADRVMVNSEWSREALIAEGVPEAKLVVVPIPYEEEFTQPVRDYPACFTQERPLRLLFLGQINGRKGVCELLEAMLELKDEPVELAMVGRSQMEVPDRVRSLAAVHWHGQIAHHGAGRFFDHADLFVLPTHSDGFGLTQVEALAHGLPVLTTPFCAQVVDNGVNGRVLSDASVRSIVTAIREVLANPRQLADWSANAKVPHRCRMEPVSRQLAALVGEMSGG